MKKQFLEIGKIVGTHGLKGEVRIDPWCDSAAFLCRLKRLYEADGMERAIVSAKVHKNVAIILFKDVHTVEEADRLRGRIVYLNRDDVKLPKGTHFIQDLLGLTVEDADNGHVYGTITDVLKTGANDVYQVSKDGRDYLIPVIPEVVLEKDIDGGVVKIRPMKGLFDDED
ncbi:MAG: 16S rRNA processing protein RimM [Clostridia bacterium]|nr:16S rRNA processing protein RimM [Clostridia bacterium]HCA56198.1 16S rRNA processing protein RimM [Oscillospiraceae bacterium]